MFDSEVLESEVFEAPPESYDRFDLSDVEWALLDLPIEVGRPGVPAGLEGLEPGGPSVRSFPPSTSPRFPVAPVLDCSVPTNGRHPTTRLPSIPI
jgi:hypothetical protein